jgi:Peptidase family M23/Putative peptidoglycan binding domain
MTWVNPAVGNATPLFNDKGMAVKGYGPRDPIKLPNKGITTYPFHAGVDISGPVGTPVRAVDTGVVVYAGWAGAGITTGRSGKAIVLRHTDGAATYYGHLDVTLVSLGQTVPRGRTIGEMGKTGNVTGPHLHFEVRPKWSSLATVDPVAWARDEGVELGRNEYPLAYVVEVQRLLNRVANAGLVEDGDLGEATRAGVKAFQEVVGLFPDGDPGALTMTALRAAAKEGDDVPRFIRAKGTARVYLTDGVRKRHIPSMTALKEEQVVWGDTKVYDVSAATLGAIPDMIDDAALERVIVEAVKSMPGGLDPEAVAQGIFTRIKGQWSA